MKNIKNLFILFTLGLMCAVLLAGCSSAKGISGNSMADMNYGIDAVNANYADESYEMEKPSLGSFDGKMSYSYDLLAADSPSTPSNLPADRKIIRDANVTMEVAKVEESFERILAQVARFGGYEASRDMYSNYDRNPTVYAVFKIPAGKLDNFLSELKNEGDIINSSISSSDITDQYYDSKTRLTTLEKTLDKYYEFLDNAKDVEEQLAVTNYIDRTTYEIEQLKGSLKRWDSLVDYSTVSLNLYKIYEAPVPERMIEWSSLSIDDMGWLITSGFVRVCNAIFSIIQWILIAFAVISPVLIPIAVFIYFMIRYHNKKKKQARIIKNENVKSDKIE